MQRFSGLVLKHFILPCSREERDKLFVQQLDLRPTNSEMMVQIPRGFFSFTARYFNVECLKAGP